MKNKVKTIIMGMCLLMLAGAAEAKTIRATELSSSFGSQVSKGSAGDITVEFHQGDELPVTFAAQGDLLETTKPAVSYIGVKRDFWLKLEQNNLQISLDGTSFKDIKDVLSGSFTAGAGSEQNGGIASAINLAFQAYLK